MRILIEEYQYDAADVRDVLMPAVNNMNCGINIRKIVK